MRTDQYIKGDIALIKVIENLIKQGFVPLLPFGEQYPYDLVALNPNNNRTFRLQVKYMGSKRMELDNSRHWSDGKNSKGYDETSFDFYACYIPSVECVIYPSIKYCGKRIKTRENISHLPSFYWYEDFLELKEHFPEQRTKESLNLEKPDWLIKPKVELRKYSRPTKEELEKLIWQKPLTVLAKEFGCWDNTIRKWCKNYGITNLPSNGYWQRRESGMSHEEALNPPIKEKHVLKRLSDEQVIDILKSLKENISLRDIAKKHNTCHQVIMKIRDNESYKYINRI